MIDDGAEPLPITTYYIKHKDVLDDRFVDIPINERQLITDQHGRKSNGSMQLSVMYAMFECNYFREIRQCEQDILATCEFDNHLNDYTELNYDEESCCKPESHDMKQITEWSHVYYADYETDVTRSRHKLYLC